MVSKNKFKIIIFRIILYLPLVVLLSVLFSFSYNVLKLNIFDYEQTYSNIASTLNEKYNFIENITITSKSVEFYNANSAGMHSPGRKKFNYENNSKLIFVYGGSSVVAPNYEKVFAKFLELKFGEKFTIINLGVDAYSSAFIKRRINSTLQNEIKPSLIIFYSGHNDYTNLYLSAVNQKTSVIKKAFLFNLFQSYLEKLKFEHYEFTEDLNSFRYVPAVPNIDFIIEPRLKKYLQKTGIVTFDNSQFRKYNELILKHYAQNLHEIIDLTQQNNIPLIIITPISNLEAEPFGVNKYTWDIYQQGLKEQKYKRRINLLTEAKDNEVFSGNIRVKSELNDFLRSVNETNVYILDLEEELITRNFTFNYDDFYDYYHMRPETHRQVAEILYGFINNEELV